MFNIGTQELLIILFVVLLLFGAKRIPEVARSLGKGVGDFRDALSGVERELKGETKATPGSAGGTAPQTAVPAVPASGQTPPAVPDAPKPEAPVPPGEGTGLAG